MAAPFTRLNLGRGPAIVTYSGSTFFARGDISPRHMPGWDPVMTSMYGEVDESKNDLVIKVNLPLFGLWSSLSTLFPAYALNPATGASVFGASDVPLVILGRNGDQITYTSAQITKLADLYLGVDSEIFAADVEFTCLKGNANNPEDASAYYAVGTGTYADSAFAKTNFLKARWTGAWGSIAGFTSFVAQKGFQVGWDLKLSPVKVDGWGTCDMTMESMVATCKCIPIMPTLAQLETAAQAQGVALGALLSGSSANLVLTGGGHSVTLNGAGIAEHGYAFGQVPLRLGEVAWKTTRGFTLGVPGAVGAVS